MGLPKFETQGSLFESLGSIAPQLFDQLDRYKLFALKIWPLLSGCREELAQCYDQGNGRPGVEPVVLLGVSIFQFLERSGLNFGPSSGERYVENKFDFRSAPEVLTSKHRQSGIDAKALLEWVEPMRGEVRYAPTVELLRVVFEQQYEVIQGEIQG